MIRWIGTEVRVFAYFQNLALIACFLGFGLGCYWAARHKSLIFSLFGIAGLVILAEAPLRRWQDFLIALSARLSVSPDAAMWGYMGELAGPTSWFLLLLASVTATAIFLLLLLITMIPLGQWTGFYLDRASNPIQAYSANLLGSVAGIWIFAGMSFLWLSPVCWFALAMALLVLMPPVSWRLGLAASSLWSAFSCLSGIHSIQIARPTGLRTRNLMFKHLGTMSTVSTSTTPATWGLPMLLRTFCAGIPRSPTIWSRARMMRHFASRKVRTMY